MRVFASGWLANSKKEQKAFAWDGSGSDRGGLPRRGLVAHQPWAGFALPHSCQKGVHEPDQNCGTFLVRKMPGAWQDNARVVIRQTDPLPLTVLAVIPSGITGG